MGIEDTNHDLQPRLSDRPFFVDRMHCETWTDEALLLLEVQPPMEIKPERIEYMKANLEYAKNLLSQEIYLPQKEIDTKFRPLVRDIMENEEKWGEVGHLYAQVWNYLAIEMAVENQD